MEGIDFSFGSGMTAQEIKHFGKGFVCRYLSGGNSKDISKSELANYLGADIKVVLVWETTAERMLSSNPGGKTDAQKANAQAVSLGVGTIPIYFACDWDANPGQQAAIDSYLDGAASVIGRGRTGIYAGFYPLKRAFEAGKITFGWQTYAWSGGQWHPRAGIQQYDDNVELGPAQVDLDRSMAHDFGQWPRPTHE